MTRKARIIIWTVCFLIFVIGLIYLIHPINPKIRVGTTEFYVEIAATSEEKMKGLGGREILEPNTGMVFPYDHKEEYSFWMKGMQFPLDFVWIADQIVVDLTENVQPTTSGEITTVKPKLPVNQILELNAGDIKKHNIQIGDSVRYILK